MSVRMTSAGGCGWISDRLGYRYETVHPMDSPGPTFPNPSCHSGRDTEVPRGIRIGCLINHYAEGARMGMHQDNDERDMTWPVVSISLGDSALSRIGTVNVAVQPSRSGWNPVISPSWAGAQGCCITGSIASSLEVRGCCREAAGSMLR